MLTGSSGEQIAWTASAAKRREWRIAAARTSALPRKFTRKCLQTATVWRGKMLDALRCCFPVHAVPTRWSEETCTLRTYRINLNAQASIWPKTHPPFNRSRSKDSTDLNAAGRYAASVANAPSSQSRDAGPSLSTDEWHHVEDRTHGFEPVNLQLAEDVQALQAANLGWPAVAN